MNNISTDNGYQQLEDVAEQGNETVITMNDETDSFINEGNGEDEEDEEDDDVIIYNIYEGFITLYF